MKKLNLAIALLFGMLIVPLSVLASVEFTEVDTITAGDKPSSMTMTPDGGRLYVVNGVNLPKNILVIDTSTHIVVATIPLDVGFPGGIAITPDGRYAYLAVSNASGSIASGGANRVEVIDTSTNSIIATIPIDSVSTYGPTLIAITPDGKEVYVTIRGSNKVDVINTTTNTVVDSIPLGGGTIPVGIAITPDGSRAYVANRHNSTISVIDTTTKAITATIPLSIGKSTSSTSVAITPNGNYAYVTYTEFGTIAVIDTNPVSATFNQQVGSISTTSTYLRTVKVTSDGKLAFVVSANSNEMLVINTDFGSPKFHTQIGAVKVGNSPYDVVSVSQNSSVVAYVSNLSDGTISVIGYKETCQLYGVHDEGLNDSQLFTVNPGDFAVNALGGLHENYDLEALDIHPQTGELFAASGDNTDKKGHLYKVDQKGELNDLGYTGCREVDGLSFHPNGTLWGWGQDCGLLTIDTTTGQANVVVEYSGEVEDLTWNTAGTILYGVENLHEDHKPDSHGPLDHEGGQALLAYTLSTDALSTDTLSTGILEEICQPLISSLEQEIEALDTLPDGTLIFGFHGNTGLTLGVIDVTTCQIIAEEEISTDYNDVEGIAWPNCQ